MVINVLGVAFERRVGAGSSPAHQAFALLEQERWQPDGANFRMLIAPCRWWGAAELVAEQARGADAIVLFGSRKAKRGATVARFARNEAKRAPDNAGLYWPGAELAPGAPPVLASTLNAERMALAMRFAGLPARSRARADRYVYNHCFYRLLAAAATPPVALVRLPTSIESARREGEAGFVNRMQIVAGVAAAISFAAAAVEPVAIAERAQIAAEAAACAA